MGKTNVGPIKHFKKNEQDKYFEINYESGATAKLKILKDNVLRYIMSPKGTISEGRFIAIFIEKDDFGPDAFNGTTILGEYSVQTKEITISFEKGTGKMTIKLNSGVEVVKEAEPLSYDDNEITQVLYTRKEEHFYGTPYTNEYKECKGDVKGGFKTSFFYSSKGYGSYRERGKQFNFGSTKSTLTYETPTFDAFYFIDVNKKFEGILREYFEITGYPPLLPENALYLIHCAGFSTYNWVKVEATDDGAILFEDDYYYKRLTSKDNEDKKEIRGSLLGEEDKGFKFSAKAVIDRYKEHDMPLGCIMIKDSLKNDIENLKTFVKYASKNNVEVGAVCKGDDKTYELEIKEVEAGISSIYIDVKPSIPLEEARALFKILSVNADTRLMLAWDIRWHAFQKYVSQLIDVASERQWDMFNIEKLSIIHSGLNGAPLVGANFAGGKNGNFNIRQFQWKTFIPLQFISDSHSSNPETPFVQHDDKATNINRAYLKLRSMLVPYNYTIAEEATRGLPMMRAMFIEFPEDKDSWNGDTWMLQYMWGPNLLVAPINKNDKNSSEQSVKDDIYLPDSNQEWIDFFTGKVHKGGRVLDQQNYPIWKYPVFVRSGAIIPWVDPNNNPKDIDRTKRMFSIYPRIGKDEFTVYEDDGTSLKYKKDNKYAKTKIEAKGLESRELVITINKTKGDYEKMEKNRATIICIFSSEDLNDWKVEINNEVINLTKTYNAIEFSIMHDISTFDNKFTVNPYLEDIAGDEIAQTFFLIKLAECDVTTSTITVTIKDYNFNVTEGA